MRAPALRARAGEAAQGRVDVDIAVGDHFRAGADHGQHDQIAALGVDLLAGAHGTVDDHGAGGRGRFRRCGLVGGFRHVCAERAGVALLV